MSQFNYSRNITFDEPVASPLCLGICVAIQLFAEYNFWLVDISTIIKKIIVAIQLFAEYNFW